MPTIEIHGKQVHVPEDSHSVHHAVKFLNESKDIANDIFAAAHHNHITGVTHFETHRPVGYHGSTDFTVIHKTDGTYELKKKSHHII